MNLEGSAPSVLLSWKKGESGFLFRNSKRLRFVLFILLTGLVVLLMNTNARSSLAYYQLQLAFEWEEEIPSNQSGSIASLLTRTRDEEPLPESSEIPGATVRTSSNTSIIENIPSLSVREQDKQGSNNVSAHKIATESFEWRAYPPADCPKNMVFRSPTGDDDDSSRNNNKKTSTIHQSNRYGDRVGMVTIALKKKDAYRKWATQMVQSVRRRGAWLGPIILIVDSTVGSEGFRKKLWQEEQKYFGGTATSNNHNNTSNSPTSIRSNIHIVQIENSDLTALKRPWMKYKRFKTQLFDLLPAELQHLDYLLYLDVDVVIGNPIVDFLDRTLPLFSSSVDKTNPAWLFFEEQGSHPAKGVAKEHKWTLFHGGIFVIHREYSRVCLQEWQKRFDTDYFPNDQSGLLDILYGNNTNNKNGSNGNNCAVGKIPSNQLMMPTRGPLRAGKTTTFVHFTKVRLKRLGELTNQYKKCALLLDHGLEMS